MKKILIIVSIFIVSIFLVTFTKALYTSSSIWNYYLNSKGFYLETDLDKTKINNHYNGENLSFTVSNSFDDKYTEDDITYEVTCTVSEALCKIGDVEGTFKSTLSGGDKSNEVISLNIINENNLKDLEVNIKIMSTSPYKKTIEAKYLLHYDSVGNISYEVVNYNDYSNLNISNYYDEDKCIKVRWEDSEIKVLNNDISILATDSNGYINEFSIDVSRKTTASIKFYKLDGTLDKASFFVEECVAP